MSQRTSKSCLAFGIGFWVASLGGCVPTPAPSDNEEPIYNNTTDATNRSATYVGADACRACHPQIAEQHTIHGHAHKLTAVQGGPPEFPEEGLRAGVPEPPEGYTWADIAYVIGGYTRKGRYIDNDGYVLTTGLTGVNTQWNLDFGPNGVEAGFVPYEASATVPKPYDFACFTCHTTGAEPQNEDFPEYQDNRPGFIGTWAESGIQCEECHGPGSNHIPVPEERDIFVDVTVNSCGQCHTRGTDPNVIIAAGGFIQHHEQYPELLASGGHADFDCTACHDPHISTNYSRETAIRNECTDCHADLNMAMHEGYVYVRGDYTEALSCESCHMPYATKSAAAASAEVVGLEGRMGDTRTHIFRVETAEDKLTYLSMFTEDGAAVAKDAEGRAAVTVDFVCLRCHNDVGNAFTISLDTANEIAFRIHGQ